MHSNVSNNSGTIRKYSNHKVPLVTIEGMKSARQEKERCFWHISFKYQRAIEWVDKTRGVGNDDDDFQLLLSYT